MVGHCLGKAEVAGSNPARGSILDEVDSLRSLVYIPVFSLIYGGVKLLFCLLIVMVTEESEISVVTSSFSTDLNISDDASAR